MAPAVGMNGIYSATYSGNPVFEFNIEGNNVMRRRHDDYINATHILKVANYDKPARTRILEREVQKGVHEKIQGGYGKYQGTWVPLKDGRTLAERNHVLDKLRPIFDFVPGNTSPPQAPKHTTNSNKPRIPKLTNGKRVPKPKVNPYCGQMNDDYNNISNQLHDDDSVDNSTIASASLMEDDEAYAGGHHQHGGTTSLKRKRGPEDIVDQEHMYYADQLLDYFMLSASETPYGVDPPEIPAHFQIDRAIDDQAHTALHWGAAMGDIDIVQSFLVRGANPNACNKRGETPLVRAVLFTNNYEKGTMPKLVHQLLHTLKSEDNHGATILHHIAMTTSSLAKKKCARYYLDVVLNKLFETYPLHECMNFANQRDSNGDTALHIVARHNAKKCIRAFQGRGIRGDLYNSADETADQIMQKTRSLHHDFLSSSPVLPSRGLPNGHEVAISSKSNAATHYQSQSARSFNQSFGSIAQDKGLQVALALESEVREKDFDLSESKRLREQRDNERQQVRQSRMTQMGEDLDLYDDVEDSKKQEDERRLLTQNESLSEQIQHKDLHNTVRTEEHHLPRSAHKKNEDSIVNDAELRDQGRAAYALAEEQGKRRKLTTAVVKAQAAAGMGQHGEKVKGLIALTCNVPSDEVAGIVPELLDELQQSKLELGGGMTTMA